jgi:hypothetical protein
MAKFTLAYVVMAGDDPHERLDIVGVFAGPQAEAKADALQKDLYNCDYSERILQKRLAGGRNPVQTVLRRHGFKGVDVSFYWVTTVSIIKVPLIEA